MTGRLGRVSPLSVIMAILFVSQAILLRTYDRQRDRLLGPEGPPPLFGVALLGFKSVVSDLMWIESDRYFHDGRFELAIGALNVAAMTDPKFVQAWALGAWHMIYNFKQVPEGFQFLRRGIKENPDHYRLFFEMSFNQYFKLEDFEEALSFAQEAVLHPDRDTGEPHPSYVERLLAHAYEDVGGIENWKKAMEVWEIVHQAEPTDTVPATFEEKLKMKIEAETLASAGQIQEALSQWEKILQKHPMDRNSNQAIEALRLKLGLPIRPPDPVDTMDLPPVRGGASQNAQPSPP